jgi:hypothetical protein
MTDSPATIEDVSAATAALIVAEELTRLRTAPPAEVFGLLHRFIATSIRAYLDALDNWSVDD